ncbi:hypothetical protein DKX38_023165 [Salix brachista]|uniref:LOB domain-containing protein n=1 Tax=Salix brachista TaxID=2182728 RepID=A0A5N5K347_9ROSI|nr:hypothetical protein DKX38_023165 [Salix brachista]
MLKLPFPILSKNPDILTTKLTHQASEVSITPPPPDFDFRNVLVLYLPGGIVEPEGVWLVGTNQLESWILPVKMIYHSGFLNLVLPLVKRACSWCTVTRSLEPGFQAFAAGCHYISFFRAASFVMQMVILKLSKTKINSINHGQKLVSVAKKPCKYLRRRCPSDCIFSPYFPSSNPQRFASVHRIHGACNVAKMLQQLPSAHLRAEAANSLYYEAQCRTRDPVYGCVGIISSLHQQIHSVESQLAKTKAEIAVLDSLAHQPAQIQ